MLSEMVTKINFDVSDEFEFLKQNSLSLHILLQKFIEIFVTNIEKIASWFQKQFDESIKAADEKPQNVRLSKRWGTFANDGLKYLFREETIFKARF